MDGLREGLGTCCPPQPATVACRALPCQPLPHVCTLHCHAHAIMQAPSLCALCLRARSVILHAPSLCVLHRCARSVVVHAPSSWVLHLGRRFIVVHTPSLCTLSCKLHHCACSVFMCALSCVLCHACSIVVHAPSSHLPVATEDNPELGSQWQGGLCVGTHAHRQGTSSIPPATASPAPAHPRPARVNTRGGRMPVSPRASSEMNVAFNIPSFNPYLS